MIYLFLGAPGSGKGTISSYLVEHENFKHISTGDIFRKMSKESSPLADKLRAVINSGKLVDDNLTFEVLLSALEKLDPVKEKIIFDGYPRTVNQAQLLENYLADKEYKLDKAFNFEVEHDVIIKRLSGRLYCNKCARVFHKETLKPKVEGICDFEGNKLIQRVDDQKENTEVRLVAYNKNINPLIDFYNKKGNLVNINAEKDIPVIGKKLLSHLGDE